MSVSIFKKNIMNKTFFIFLIILIILFIIRYYVSCKNQEGYEMIKLVEEDTYDNIEVNMDKILEKTQKL